MDWRIKLLGPDDAAAVLAADVFDGPALAASVARFLGPPGQSDPRLLLVVAERQGRIVGFASGALIDHPDKPRALFIAELGVNEDVRRLGIGRALLSALRAEGRQRGCAESWVATEEDNIAARALYRGEGGDETTGIVMYSWTESEEADSGAE